MFSTIIQKIIGTTASKIYSEVGAKQIMIVDGIKSKNYEDKIDTLKITSILKPSNKKTIFYIENEDNLNFETKIKNIIVKGIKLKLIDKESKVVLIFDNGISEEFNIGMLIIEVSRILYRIAKFKLNEFMENEAVLEKLIKIAEDIRNEGREGSKIGTLFVIGDEIELTEYTKPLILNPFFGYPENLRDLFSADLGETIKEYAQLDGAFVINNRGIVISAGTYIDVDTSNIKKYYGWGTKHLAAVAITEKTNSIAILISESGNMIKIFKKGKLILKF